MRFEGIPFWAVMALVAATAGMLAALHLLRVRSIPVRVVTTLFWTSVAEQTRARTLLDRLRHPLTYAVLLLIASLVALALGRPERHTERSDRIWTVLVLDAGASMSAKDIETGRPRLAAACDVVKAYAVAATDPLAVIVADPWPRLIHGFDDPRPALGKRLMKIEPASVPANDGAAISLAKSLLAGHGNAEILLVTDRPADGDINASASVGIPRVRAIRVGRSVPNAAILSAMFEPDQDNPFRGVFRVRVGSWSSSPSSFLARIRRVGGAQLLDTRRSIESGSTVDLSLGDLQTDGDTLLVELSGDDAVEADSKTLFRLPLRRPICVRIGESIPKPIRILLDTAPELKTALRKDKEDVRIAVGTLESVFPVPTIVIIDGDGSVEDSSRVHVLGESPLIRNVAFEDAFCSKGAALGKLPSHAEPLLGAGQPVLAAMISNPGPARLLISRSLVADGATVPHRAAFAVFLIQAIQRLSGWDSDPLVLTPERATNDPIFAGAHVSPSGLRVMPGSRFGSNLTASAGEPSSVLNPRRWFTPEPFEVLLAMALGMAGLEALLHLRGRIS